jgi:hypothetical protein
VQELLWRPAPWVLLTIASALLLGLRGGRWRLLLIGLAVPLGALGSYVASPAAQDARYTYAATLICQLLTVGNVAVWLRERRRPEAGGQVEGDSAVAVALRRRRRMRQRT